ncbi:MAG: DUF4212 domain-containing protein [Rhodocyclaceae bacterium]|nr:DUF4212 domain-containing protein [Rhodocyclaceae bacterium]
MTPLFPDKPKSHGRLPPGDIAGGEAPADNARCGNYWNRTLRLTAGFLGVWAAATFLPIWFAPEMEGLHFFGWPLAYYLAAQGSLLVFVLIVWIYAGFMEHLDRECMSPGRPDKEA